MINTQLTPFTLAFHLRNTFKGYLSDKKTIDLSNPAELCGLCFCVESSAVFDHDIRNFDALFIKTIGWDCLIAAFDALDMQQCCALLKRAKQRPKNYEAIIYEWEGLGENNCFNRCASYLKPHISSPEIQRVLGALPPLELPSTPAIELAAEHCNADYLRQCIEQGEDPNYESENGTSLAAACVRFYKSDLCELSELEACLDILVENGLDTSSDANKILLNDVQSDYAALLALLRRGWDVNDTGRDSPVFNLLEEIIRRKPHASKKILYRLFQCLMLMVDGYKADLNRIDYDHGLPLLCLSNDVELNRILLKYGALPDIPAETGFHHISPLFYAVIKNDLQRVKEWLNFGCSANIRLYQSYTASNANYLAVGTTPLDAAKKLGHTQIVAYLEEFGAIHGEVMSYGVVAQRFLFEDDAIDVESIVQIIHTLIPPKNSKNAQRQFKSYSEEKSYLRYQIKRLINRKKPFIITEYGSRDEAVKMSKSLQNIGILVSIT